MEEIVTIELFGQPYSFKADAEVTQAQEVADHLVKEVARVEIQHSGTTSNISKLTILMLAALNIANENMKLKKNYSQILRIISERSMNLIRTLDNSVQ